MVAKLRHLTFLICITIVAQITIASQASARLTPPTAHDLLIGGQTRFGLGVGYLRTSSNFGNESSTEALCTGCLVQSVSTTAFIEHGFNNFMTAYADLLFVGNVVDGPSSSGVSGATTRNYAFGPGDADVGLRLAAATDPVMILFDGSILFPTYPRLSSDQWNTFTNGGAVPRGNGVSVFTGLLRIELPLQKTTDQSGVFFGGTFGYSAPTGGFSTYFPYGLYVRYERPRIYFGRLGIAGQLSSQNDSFTADATSAERGTAALAGSKLYNAVNPTVLKAEAEFGAYVGTTTFLAIQASFPLGGTNVPKDPAFVGAIGFDFGGVTKTSGYEHSNRGFQEYYLASRVIKVNNDLNQVLIDRGQNDGIRMGEILDIFEPDSGEATPGRTIARGKVIEAGFTRSKIQVHEFFIDKRLEEGFVVRRPVH